VVREAGQGDRAPDRRREGRARKASCFVRLSTKKFQLALKEKFSFFHLADRSTPQLGDRVTSIRKVEV